MNFLNLSNFFKSDEAGAVTVDWVVLTAAIVGLGLVVAVSVSPGILSLGGAIGTEVGAQHVGM